MLILKISNYLLKKYILENKEEWDPAGWALHFKLNRRIRGVVVALDLTPTVLEKALSSDSNLIVTHHPFKFYETWKEEFEYAPYKKKIFEALNENRINVLCLHTNYDNYKYGTSYQIAKRLDLSENISHFENTNYPVAIKDVNLPLSNIINAVKQQLNLFQMRTNILNEDINNKIINNIVIFAGSGSISEINKVSSDYDLIITSDVKWSDWLTYSELQTPILEISHLSEQAFVYDIYSQLKEHFPDRNISMVKIDKEPYSNI